MHTIKTVISRKLIFHLFLLITVLTILAWSGLNPKERSTWIMEVLPVFIGLILIFKTYKNFPLTKLLYILITVHCLILCIGGKYTYAEVPLGFWFRDVFHLVRNNYDRLGHFAQGFVPAILARELLIRNHVIKNKKWLVLIVTSLCLSFSAFYELIEWAAALILGEGATAFLGTQGDIWDTQWDMFNALIGSVTAQLLLSRYHDQQLLEFKSQSPAQISMAKQSSRFS